MVPISHRAVELMPLDRGLAVDHTTLLRWIQAYVRIEREFEEMGSDRRIAEYLGAPPLRAEPAGPAPHGAPTRLTYEVGDKLRLAFYEPLTPEKWAAVGQQRAPGPSFYLHNELSGDYVVEEDWTISVPLLGSVVIAGRTAEQIQADLGKTFEKVLGHVGFVTVNIVERGPVYIVGFVKTAGVYKYALGLTPLKLVALAGGLPVGDEDKWAKVEVVRETSRQQASTARLQRVLAESAVLGAQIAGGPVQVPEQLVALAGQRGAEDLLREEQGGRAPLAQARSDRSKTLQAAIDSAKHAIEIDQSRLPALSDNIRAMQARLNSLQALFQGHQISQVMVTQAQSELTNVEDRRASVLSSIAADEARLSGAKTDLSKFDTDTKAEIDQTLAARQREIDELMPAVTGSAGIIRLLNPPTAAASTDALRFSVVRDGQVISADVTTALRPGDLVRVDTDQPVLYGGDASRRGYIASSARP